MSQEEFDNITTEMRANFFPKLGNRDIVGYGSNGQEDYLDDEEYPCPAIRFRENTPEFLALRQKEMGDWKELTLEERKELYRHNYRQTFAEINAPTGHWKVMLAGFFAAFTVTAWGLIFLKVFVRSSTPPLCETEQKIAQVERQVRSYNNPISGYASRYDYENKKWK